MLRKAARQSTESEVTVCLTPEVKGKTFQEKGVVNGAITARDERKLTWPKQQTLAWDAAQLQSMLRMLRAKSLISSTARENKNRPK